MLAKPETTPSMHGTVTTTPRHSPRVAETIGIWFERLFALIILGLLIFGWSIREDNNLSAEEGTGYMLGIVGGSAMLLLLLYPLRKQARFMRRLGAVKHWFRLHMLLGVLGPVLILFHANFSLGSLNSNLAFFSMLLVAGSGLIGRYIYTKIHHGLYGQRTTLQELRQELKITKGKLSGHLQLSARNVDRIKRLEAYVLKRRSLMSILLQLPLIHLRCIWTRHTIIRSVRKDLRRQSAARGWDKRMLHALVHDAFRRLKSYIESMRVLTTFTMYERLFGLWHVAHFPLFILLLITGIVHVIAVHIY